MLKNAPHPTLQKLNAMKLQLATIFFIILEHINRVLTQGIPVSPCPKIFQYRFDGTEWFGLLSLRNPDFGQALHLRVTLSMRGKPTTNYLGEIELLTRGQFLSETPVLYKIKFPKNHFPPKLLQITANNHVVCFGIADHSIFVTQIQLEHTRKFTFMPKDKPETLPLEPDIFTFLSSLSPSSSSSWSPTSAVDSMDTDSLQHEQLPTNTQFATKHLPQASLEKHPKQAKEICGIIDERIRFQAMQAAGITQALSFGKRGKGASIASDEVDNDSSTVSDAQPLSSLTRGAWPWLAAIYVNNLTSLDYQCSGTLVSAYVVVSSAHCFKLIRRRYTADEVLVFLGRYNLKNWNEEASLAALVSEIYIHPDYDSNLKTYDADIAVVMLKHQVRFNTFIRPACMWRGQTKQEFIAGEHGFVVGWDLGNSNVSTSTESATSTIPRILHTPILSNEVCFQANQNFRSLSSNRTFCAGTVSTTQRKLKSTNLCTGDSGAGLMIFKNNRWFLRGTLSATLLQSDKTMTTTTNASKIAATCNNNQYFIYTDVAQFLDWIFAFVPFG